MRVRASGVLLCLVLSACGVRGQDEPEPLPTGIVPSELRPSTSTSSPPAARTAGTDAG